MALKTFNLDDEIYKQYSKHCREHGISMSKQVEKFIGEQVSRLKNPQVQMTEIGDKKSAEPARHETKEKHPMSRYC